ncbi:unnamed protein product [Urochloa humidicola]
MSRVEITFQEYQDRREGLIKASSKGLATLIEEGKKINKHTPYEERKCLWGLKNKCWELKRPIYPTFEKPPHPQPLPEFDEAVTTLTEWMSLVSDYSDAWLAGFSAYNSLSFSQHERMELFGRMHELPCLKDVVVLPHISEPKPDTGLPLPAAQD